MSNKSLDLDELFGFTEARRRLEKKDEKLYAEPDFIPYRIFFNNIDSFHGHHFAEFISDQVQGVLKREKIGEEGEEEETEGEHKEKQIEMEEGNEDKIRKEKKTAAKNNYEIIGTVTDPTYRQTESIKDIILDPSNREVFFPKILKCGYIIYDITTDRTQIKEALWTLEAIESHLDKLQEERPKAFVKLNDIRHFILISTVMTWALTKPINADEPVPFTEADFRKRKPHPNYKEHIDLEKKVTQVGKKYKDKYKTMVIASGISYGLEEDVLHFLFKMAWQNEPILPVINPGKNKIPLIHVKDLISILYNIMEDFPSKRRYILAVEMTVSNLKSIVKAISTTLSTGKYRTLMKEEAFFIPEVTQMLYDLLTVDLNMEPAYIVENLIIDWVSEIGFIENIQQIVEEYKQARHLQPLRIFVHGPPAVGKTRIAKRLCAYYKLHYLHVTELINNVIAELKEKAESMKAQEKEEVQVHEEVEGEGEEEEKETEMKESIEEIYELLKEIENNIKENNGRLAEHYVIRFFKEKMISNPCQNQGFVLDGYPQTIKEAKALFDTMDEEEEIEEEEEEEEEEKLSYNKKIMPEYVISLNAPDDVLYCRVMDLPEKEIQGTIYTEQNMIRRVSKFRESNTADKTVLNYFDELEVHPFQINVAEDDDPRMENIFQAIINKIGAPRNYGEEGEDELSVQAKLIEEQKAHEEKKRKIEAAKKACEEQRAQMEEWANLLDALKEEEEQYFAIQGIPVRHYLMRYIFPTLTRGLLEVTRVRPDDPVNYLAEYLFRENPEGKIFHPDYTEAAEKLINASQQFQDSILKSDFCLGSDVFFSNKQSINTSQMQYKPEWSSHERFDESKLSQETAIKLGIDVSIIQSQQLLSLHDEEPRTLDCLTADIYEGAEGEDLDNN